MELGYPMREDPHPLVLPPPPSPLPRFAGEGE